MYQSVAVVSISNSYSWSDTVGKCSSMCWVPVAEEPEVIVVSEFFYLFLVVCHIGACLRSVDGYHVEML
jgi:hypothetical protein